MAEIAAIADDEGRVLGERERHLSGGPLAEDEADAALGQGPRDLRAGLEHEGVVAAVGLGIVVHQAKADHDRQPRSLAAPMAYSRA